MTTERQNAFQADLAKQIAAAEARIAEAKASAEGDLIDISTGAAEALTEKLLGKAAPKADIKKSVTAALKELA